MMVRFQDEAYKACIQDIKEKSKSETMIYKTAHRMQKIRLRVWWNRL